MGTHGDDEYHACKKNDGSAFCGFTVCYEKGCVGQEDQIFALVMMVIIILWSAS